MAPQVWNSLLALSALFTIVAYAAPHNAKHVHNKRDMLIVTDTEVVMTTVDVYVTVDASGNTIGGAPSAAPNTTTIATSTTSALGAQFFAPAPSSTFTSTSSSAAVQVPVDAAPAVSTSPPAATSTQAPAATEAPADTQAPAVYAALSPATTPAPAASSAAPATSAPAPASSAATSDGSSSGGPYTGDITFYEVGLGACGQTNQDSDLVIALPWGFMGTQSNGNPYCNKQVKITNGQYTSTATVVDKCMGCTGMSIDCSPSLFSALTGDNMGLGRVSGVTWSFV